MNLDPEIAKIKNKEMENVLRGNSEMMTKSIKLLLYQGLLMVITMGLHVFAVYR